MKISINIILSGLYRLNNEKLTAIEKLSIGQTSDLLMARSEIAALHTPLTHIRDSQSDITKRLESARRTTSAESGSTDARLETIESSFIRHAAELVVVKSNVASLQHPIFEIHNRQLGVVNSLEIIRDLIAKESEARSKQSKQSFRALQRQLQRSRKQNFHSHSQRISKGEMVSSPFWCHKCVTVIS